jgi:hypothetical protein
MAHDITSRYKDTITNPKENAAEDNINQEKQINARLQPAFVERLGSTAWSITTACGFNNEIQSI